MDYIVDCIVFQQPFRVGGTTRQERKVMTVGTTHAVVELKQVKAAVSAGGIKYMNPVIIELYPVAP